MASATQWTWVWANSRRCEGQEAWNVAVHGVAKSWTQLSNWTRTDSQAKLIGEGISLLKNCSASLIIREVQMKTTMRFRLTLVRMVIIKKTKRSVDEHLYFTGANEISALWKQYGSSTKILKTELPYDLAIPLWGIYPKEIKSLSSKNICLPMFIAALFAVIKVWK